MRLIDKYMLRKNPIKYWRNRGAIIGDDCEIYTTTSFGTEPYLITIGNHVRINAGVQLITHDGGVWVIRKLSNMENASDIDMFGKIHIKNNVHIGTNSIIMPGVTIGNNCIIGCGSIVTHNIPDNSVAAGIPARIIETIENYEQKHINDFIFTKSLKQDEKKELLQKLYFDNSLKGKK